MNSSIGLKLLLRRNYLLFCLFSITLILLFSPSISFAKDAATIFRENNKTVVVIIAYDDKGMHI
jgi:hypothetical protein